jgi:hypothetical protein
MRALAITILVACSAAAPARAPGPAVTAADVGILMRADAILVSEAVWNRRDTRECAAEDTTWSLYCALVKASLEETGAFDHRGAALEEVRVVIDERTRGVEFQHRMMDYNNLPSTTFEDIKHVLQLAIARIRARLP